MDNFFTPIPVIVTGGSGLLGSELKKLIPGAFFPSSESFNISDYDQMDELLSKNSFVAMLHCAAFTSPPKINADPIKAIETNIVGTCNVTKLCAKHNIKLIYISTDYVFDGNKGNYKEEDAVNPVNKYAWSKLGGETAVRMYDNSLIIRLSFSPKVFPYDAAFIDQWTSRERVDKVALKIVKLMNTDVKGVIHIGQKSKTVYAYAKSLDKSKEIKELSINDVNFSVPKNTSLNTSKYKKLKL